MEDEVLGSSPAAKLARELDTGNQRRLELPGGVGESVNGVGTTDTNGQHAETASVGSVRVGAEHEETGSGVVLENDLVDDTRSRGPELDTVLFSGRLEEVEHLLVLLDRAGEVSLGTSLSLDKVVTVDRGGDSTRGETAGHELEQGHLGRSVLHGDAVGAKLEVALAANLATTTERLLRVAEVGVENLLGEGELVVLAEDAADLIEGLEEAGVGRGDGGAVLGGESGRGSKAAGGHETPEGWACPLNEHW